MSKSSAKQIKIFDDKKGWIRIGDLSKNELCRGVKQLMVEGQKLQQAIEYGAMVYNNHKASLDAMNNHEVMEYYGIESK